MALPTEFPASILTGGGAKRRTIRAEVNPLDKSTVVSIFPKYIHEVKWTLQPGEFEIQPGSYDKPSLLTVGPSSWWRDVDPEQPLLEIPVSSIQIADSIVRDYCNGYVACDMGDNMPGLFYVPGNILLKQVVTDYKSLLDKAKVKQDNWYRTLVKIADVYWARTNGSPLSISDDMRLAARELGLDREWIKDMHVAEMVRCVACGNMRNPAFPVCLHCRTVIDKVAYDKLNLKPAV